MATTLKFYRRHLRLETQSVGDLKIALLFLLLPMTFELPLSYYNIHACIGGLIYEFTVLYCLL